MKKISKILFVTLISLIFIAFTLFLYIPKYVILDYFLSKNGIYLITENVKEHWDKLILKKVKLFINNEEIAHFEKVDIKLDLLALRIKGFCKNGSILLELSPHSYRIKAKEFRCLKKVPLIDGDINIKDRKIFGKFKAEGMEIQGRKVEIIVINFNGDRIKADLKVDGFDLKGEGKFKLEMPNIQKSSININLSGIINAKISGTLENPVFSLQ